MDKTKLSVLTFLATLVVLILTNSTGSTYCKKKNSKSEIFYKIESYWMFLNIPQLERQCADMQSKVEESEEITNH